MASRCRGERQTGDTHLGMPANSMQTANCRRMGVYTRAKTPTPRYVIICYARPNTAWQQRCAVGGTCKPVKR